MAEPTIPHASRDVGDVHQGIGGSQLAVIPGAGHLSSLEQPDAFNDHLAHFLTHRV